MWSLSSPERTNSSTFSLLAWNAFPFEARSRPTNFRLLLITPKLWSCSSRLALRSCSTSARSTSASLWRTCTSDCIAITSCSFSSSLSRQPERQRSYSSRSCTKVLSSQQQMEAFCLRRGSTCCACTSAPMYSSIILQLLSSPTSSRFNCRTRSFSSSSPSTRALLPSLASSRLLHSSSSPRSRPSTPRTRASNSPFSSSRRAHPSHSLPCWEASCRRNCAFSTWRCWHSCSQWLMFWLMDSSRVTNFLKMLSSGVLNLGVGTFRDFRSTYRSWITAPILSLSIFMRSISDCLACTSSCRLVISCSSRSTSPSSSLQCFSMGEVERGRGSLPVRSLVLGDSLSPESSLAVVLLAQLELLTEEGVLWTLLLSATMRECCYFIIFYIISMRLILRLSSCRRCPRRSSLSLRMLLESTTSLLSCSLSPSPSFLSPLSTSASSRSLSMFRRDCSPFSRSVASSLSRRFFSSSSRTILSLSTSFSFLERRRWLSWLRLLFLSSCRLSRWFYWFSSRFCSPSRLFSPLTLWHSSQSCRYLLSRDRLSEGATCDTLLYRSSFIYFYSAFFIFERMSSTSIIVFFMMFLAARSGLGDLQGQCRLFLRRIVLIGSRL